MSLLASAIYTMSDDEIQKIYCARGSSPMMTGTSQGVQVGFPLVALDIDISVVGFTASMEVTQTFANRSNAAMEATYIFPLPDRLAVTRFKMEVSGRVIDGVINERGAAREMYEQAIASGHRAAIAEEERPGVFTIRVGNIMPGEMPVVRMSLVGPLAVDGDEVTLQFPLLVAPRYVSGQRQWGQQAGDGAAVDTDQVPDASRVAPPVRIVGHHQSVRLSGRVAIQGVGVQIQSASSSLPMLISPNHGTLQLAITAGAVLDRDFILRWRMVGDSPSLDVTSSLVLVDDKTGREGTFALTLVPPPAMAAMQKPRDVVFVLDRSGSMGGWQMVAARRAVARMVDTLTTHDRFSVIAFDDFIEVPTFDHTHPSVTPTERNQLMHPLVTATDRNRFAGIEFLANVNARGGTEMQQPLTMAARMLSQSMDSHLVRDRTIVVVTDGQVGGEDMILAGLAPHLHATRVMTIGIDQAVNAGFLRRLAAMGAGLFELVESEDRLDAVMDKIHRRIGLPVVQQLSLTSQGFIIDMNSIAPQRVGDLFVGAPLTITGRYSRAPGGETPAVVVTGSTLGQSYRNVVTEQAESQSFLERFALAPSWARARIRDLEDRYAIGGHMTALEEIERQIVEVSLRHSVLSRFTAFVAVDNSEVANRAGHQLRLVQAVSPKPHPVVSVSAPPPAISRAMPAMSMSAPAMPMSRRAPAPAAPMAATSSKSMFGSKPSSTVPPAPSPTMEMMDDTPSSFVRSSESAADESFILRLRDIAEAFAGIKSVAMDYQQLLLQLAVVRLREWIDDAASLAQHMDVIAVAKDVLAMLIAGQIAGQLSVDIHVVEQAVKRLEEQVASRVLPASPPPVVMRNPPAPDSITEVPKEHGGSASAKAFWKRK